VRTSLVAEENLQAFLQAHRATLEYIEQNDGKWPRSWDVLQGVRPDSDYQWIAEHVTFDFNADPKEIASQTPNTFTAIVPDDPCYIIDYEVQAIIDHLAKHYRRTGHATEQTDAPKSPNGAF